MEKDLADRNKIIETVKEHLEPLPYIHALWLEGADASGFVDRYSDIDFWVDVEDACEQQSYEAVENALRAVSAFDFYEILQHGHPKIRQRIYHMKGTSKYLMIDFCWQLHSRDRQESTLIENNPVESAKILFDKTDIIRFVPYDAALFCEENTARYRQCIYRHSQRDRAIKYVRRGCYLEAYAYYNRYVLEPLIDLLRLIYTPANADYYLVHISHHIPAEDRTRLEYFAKIASLEEIEKKASEAEPWFQALLLRYRDSPHRWQAQKSEMKL